ncbi:MAG: hypothetical protein QOH31_3836 [Verrucomicrobiota bacterium]
MRMPLLPTLAGLAIGFAVPALAFEGNLAGDVKALDEFAAFGKYDEGIQNERCGRSRSALYRGRLSVTLLALPTARLKPERTA